ncbi:MAG: carbamoyltransferase [Candidatus Marinimicrobia bacterium]|nr:carbamoyltransferase [Candidatus Neomarinimicrobiota bacterium]
MNILGISAFYHDSAACVIRNGKIIAAAQEERFSRIKHDQNFPERAIKYCLEEGEISVSDLDYIVYYDKPFLKFERILETYLAYTPLGIRSFLMAIPLWIRKKLWIPDLIEKSLGYNGKILFTEHHESHAASTFFPSPFERAAFLTMDGVGEWATASFGVGSNNRITIDSELHFPHSLGLLYSTFTYYTGFRVNSGEYKVMGLAPYGEPKYVQTILDNLIDLKEDGSFKLNMKYFNYCAGLTMTNERFHRLFGRKPRKSESKLTQMDMDLARSVQVVTEEIVMRMARHVYKVTGEKYLCLAGGVALNCVANGKLLREGPFDDIWIQPAAGDAGGALGAALFTWYQYLDNPRNADNHKDSQLGSYLGPGYSNREIESFLNKHSIPHSRVDGEIIDRTVELLTQEKVVGWFQGRMEFGPRALGNRSIIGDARSPKMQRKMNLKIKYRESFRPFAPTILSERISDYFEIDRESPYMLLVAQVKKDRQIPMKEKENNFFGLEKLNVVRSDVPAITHIDYSARIQSVNAEDNPRYHQLIKKFEEKTGCPIIVNTSFNVRGEPIVQSPMDAYKCFMRTEMDYLAIGDFLLDKEDQPEFLDGIDWREEFELD